MMAPSEDQHDHVYTLSRKNPRDEETRQNTRDINIISSMTWNRRGQHE